MSESRLMPAEMLDCQECGGPLSANDRRHGYRVRDDCVYGVDAGPDYDGEENPT